LLLSNCGFRPNYGLGNQEYIVSIKNSQEVDISNEHIAFEKAHFGHTPKLQQTGITMHSSNAKDFQNSYKDTPPQFIGSTLKSDNSPYLRRRYEKEFRNGNNIDDSLNDRLLSPEKEYTDMPVFRTPNTANRRGYVQVSGFKSLFNLNSRLASDFQATIS
jgi:hypothetical protein